MRYVTIVMTVCKELTDIGLENGLNAMFDSAKVNEEIRGVLRQCIKDIQIVESDEEAR